MSATIFCTFDQQDLADIAIGRLRNSITGIKSIHYVNGYNSSAAENNASVGMAYGFYSDAKSGMADALVSPSRPVTVRIVCSDASTAAVKARLINLHAYQIVTTA